MGPCRKRRTVIAFPDHPTSSCIAYPVTLVFSSFSLPRSLSPPAPAPPGAAAFLPLSSPPSFSRLSSAFLRLFAPRPSPALSPPLPPTLFPTLFPARSLGSLAHRCFFGTPDVFLSVSSQRRQCSPDTHRVNMISFFNIFRFSSLFPVVHLCTYVFGIFL